MMDGKTVIDKLQTRYACKAFDPKRKVSDEDFHVLEEALRLAPSSFGLQLWKFIVVKDQALKEKLRPLSWNQAQITTCSHLVCLCTRLDATELQIDAHINNVASTRGLDVEVLKEYKAAMTGFISDPDMQSRLVHWINKQAYIALGFLLETAALLSIDTCPMEGFDVAGYNELLGLNGTGYTTAVLCPVGYRSPEDTYQNAKKVRFSKEQVIEYR